LIPALTEQPSLMVASRGRSERRELHREPRRRLIALLLGEGGVIAHVGDEKRALLRRQRLWADRLAGSRPGALIARVSCSPGHRSTTSVMIVMRETARIVSSPVAYSVRVALASAMTTAPSG